MPLPKRYAETLDALRADDLYRELRPLPAPGGVFLQGGRRIVNWSTNDYLDLAGDPRLAHAAAVTAEEAGSGAGASRLLAGHRPVHRALERALADLCAQPDALVFPSGYQCNTAVLGALAQPGDVVYSDALNHASLIDGIRLSKAQVMVYRHGDMDQLQRLLESHPTGGVPIIVSDSVFSMDGDLAPLAELSSLAEAFHAVLVIDEAHAIGVYGAGGGVCRELGLSPDVLLGTLSKSLGSAGGFVACSALLREYFINRARGFVFSTGLSPLAAAAALAAVELVRQHPEWGVALRTQAQALRGALRHAGFSCAPGDSPIIPIPVGENAHALALAKALRAAGHWVSAIRPPTVPAGTARLRISLTRAHRDDDLRDLVEALSGVTKGGICAASS